MPGGSSSLHVAKPSFIWRACACCPSRPRERKPDMSDPQIEATEPNEVAPRSKPAWLDWALARRELAQARINEARIDDRSRSCLRRAELAHELATDEQLQTDSGIPVALDLLRQSVFW